VGGYIKDAKVFMCPSAAGMPWDAGAMYSGQSRTDLANLIGNTGLDDTHALLGGNYPAMVANQGCPANHGWQNVVNTDTGTGYPAYGFQSSYNYRGVPISTGGAAAIPVASVSPGGIPPAGTFGVPQDVSGNSYADFTDYTTPSLYAYAGCPQYKTEKLLANRAICSDTFSKWDESLNLTTTLTTMYKQGYGVWAHRDAYNILYGDWHAKVLGDPDHKIMNFSASNNDGLAMPGCGYSDGGLGGFSTVALHQGYADISASIATIAYPGNLGGTSTPRSGYSVMPTSYLDAGGTLSTSIFSPSEGFLIWHSFDTIENIDVLSSAAAQ
jgi:hypothetical protein